MSHCSIIFNAVLNYGLFMNIYRWCYIYINSLKKKIHMLFNSQGKQKIKRNYKYQLHHNCMSNFGSQRWPSSLDLNSQPSRVILLLSSFLFFGSLDQNTSTPSYQIPTPLLLLSSHLQILKYLLSSSQPPIHHDHNPLPVLFLSNNLTTTRH